MMIGRKRRFAFDCDGVLVDYHEAYRRAWLAAFGEALQEREPQAYHASVRWGARFLERHEERRHLRSYMDSTFWRTMTAMPGAVEACDIFHRGLGYELVAVTALEECYQRERMMNLLDLGMPISQVICTGGGEDDAPISPKARVINALGSEGLDGFAEDCAPFLRGINPGVHLALIMAGHIGSPNVGADLALAHTTHPDVLDVAHYWAGPRSFKAAGTDPDRATRQMVYQA